MLISQVTGSNKLLFSYDANGNAVAVNYNGTYYYYVRNGQNDVIRLIDGSNNAVVEYTYDSWGRLLSCTGSLASTLGTQNPFRYRGYVYDAETGLYYLQTRYYDPEVGRFINADIYVSTGQGVLGNNMYLYCGNNPVSLVDSSGQSAVGLAIGGAAVIAALLAAAMIVLTVAIIGTVATDAVEKIRDDRNRGQHTVYVLKDPVTNRVEYVGRTKNYKARMNAHKNSHRGHLEPEVVADNLNYYEARALEQEMMLKYHTINTLNDINNQINGISPRSNLGKAYVELKRGVANYLSNLISDRVYALFE